MGRKRARWALACIFLGLGILAAFVLPVWLTAALLAAALIAVGIFLFRC